MTGSVTPPLMSLAPMRIGTTDTRSVNFGENLIGSVNFGENLIGSGDVIASIISITVIRQDSQPLAFGEYVISPNSFPSPVFSNISVTWWQSVGNVVTQPTNYIVTISIVTQSGRVLIADYTETVLTRLS